MAWTLYPHDTLRTRYRDAWDELNRSSHGAHPMLDTKFLLPLLQCFGSKNVYLAIEQDEDRINAAALLENVGKGNWSIFSPPQLSITPFLHEIPGCFDTWANSLRALFTSLPGFVLQIGVVDLDSNYLRFSPESGMESTVQVVRHYTTYSVQIEGNFEQYWRGLGKNLRQNIRTRLKKLEASHGPARLVELHAPADMRDAVAVHGKLESSGWKGRNGTAIAADNLQGEFYATMLENFAADDNARVYQFVVSDSVVASLLTIMQNDMMIVLKTTFDESLREFSPGRLNDYFMLQNLFEKRSFRILKCTLARARQTCAGAPRDAISRM